MKKMKKTLNKTESHTSNIHTQQKERDMTPFDQARENAAIFAENLVAMQLIGLAATEMDKLKTEDADANVKDIDRLDQFLEVAVMTQAAFQIEGMAS
ncbi:MAG: hypothetical protein CMQ51_07050 [Gammaproteobacteria bacterium]|nr:hypothetical protein [Gammaproteobacteria bacterium]|tara:strand:+ start:1802 stop:2092 length:291 start_codon:yes stop_codon:yes gene_type:complete